MLNKIIIDDYRLKGLNSYLKYYGVESEKVSATTYQFLSDYSRPVDNRLSGDSYIPIKILVSIRTDRTNEVIVPDNGKFYTECEALYPTLHPLDDAVMLCAKTLVDSVFDCGEDIVKVITRTAPHLVGACFINRVFYVYMNVVVDHTLKSESFFNIKDAHYENITSLTPTNRLESSLIDSLTIVYNMQGGES